MLAKCTTENGRTHKIDIVISGALSLTPGFSPVHSNTSAPRFAQRSGYRFGAAGKNREEKINSPPGLELGVVASKLFETVIKRRASVPLSLR
jgi:hypothetical protein